MAHNDAPLDLYVAAYDDAAGAQQDWDGMKELAKAKAISVEFDNVIIDELDPDVLGGAHAFGEQVRE